MKLSESAASRLSKAGVSLRIIERPGLQLRLIEPRDSELLRVWKNTHRLSFFHKDVILPSAQKRWLSVYLKRTNDWMFMVEYKGEAIGCMGFRQLEDGVDVYNVILGRPEHAGQGHMGAALRAMCEYASQVHSHIGLKVLRSNPAKSWYEKNGFIVVSEADDYFRLALDRSRFHPCEFHEEIA